MEDGSMGNETNLELLKKPERKSSGNLFKVPTTLEAVLALGVSFIVVIIGIRLKVGMTAPLIAGTFTASLFGIYFGHRWKDLQDAMIEGIANALPAIIILLLVGMIIGIWIIGGTVPTMVYFGLKLLSPRLFLAATFILCAIVSTATGTSFGTVGTVGLALIGIGQGLGLPLPMVAGAIVAGAYFGDKMSPLSDTTNVAPAMAGANLFDHIGSMMYTTVPAFVISLIAYVILGFIYGGQNADVQDVQQLLTTISRTFSVSVWTLVPPLAVIAMSVLRIPAIPALTFGVILSIVWSMFMQGIGFVTVIGASSLLIPRKLKTPRSLPRKWPTTWALSHPSLKRRWRAGKRAATWCSIPT
jgi:NhaC family Na+:H+ antiporter